MCGLTLLAALVWGCSGGGSPATDDTANDGGVPDAGHDIGDDAGPSPSDAGPDAELPEGCPACTASAPWACAPCLPVPLQEISATTLEGAVVIAGGFESPASIVTTVRRFDGASWSTLPDLPAPRHHLALVGLDGDLYAIGGMETLSFEPRAEGWVLRSGADAWATIAPLPEARAAGAAAALGGEVIFAAGQGPGATTSEQLASAAPVFRYDPAEDRWSTGSPIPTPREHVAYFAHAGELWVLAGRSIALTPTLATVEIYDPASDTWRDGPDSPTPHGGAAATVLDGVAYLGGGEERDQALRTFEALDLASGEWRTLAPIPTPRHGHAMAALAGRVLVIGGANRPVFAAVPTVEAYAP